MGPATISIYLNDEAELCTASMRLQVRKCFVSEFQALGLFGRRPGHATEGPFVLTTVERPTCSRPVQAFESYTRIHWTSGLGRVQRSRIAPCISARWTISTASPARIDAVDPRQDEKSASSPGRIRPINSAARPARSRRRGSTCGLRLPTRI